MAQLHCNSVNQHFNTSIMAYYPGFIRERGFVMDVCACRSVCPHTYISETTWIYFIEFSTHVAYDRDSILIWRRWNALRKSGFVGDVTFRHDKPYGAGYGLAKGNTDSTPQPIHCVSWKSDIHLSIAYLLIIYQNYQNPFLRVEVTASRSCGIFESRCVHQVAARDWGAESDV